MKRIVIFLLVLLLIVPIVACAKPSDNTPADSTTVGEQDGTDSTEETASPNEADDLGNPDFNNAVFNILTRKSTSYEIKSD